jgi:hypothetical protein
MKLSKDDEKKGSQWLISNDFGNRGKLSRKNFVDAL